MTSDRLAVLREAQRRREGITRPSGERPPRSLTVVASCLGSGVSIVGVTHDVSPSGLSMHMPQRPTTVLHDVTVHDGDLSVALWVRVVACQPTGGDMYLWQVHVVTADDGWSRIVTRVRL